MHIHTISTDHTRIQIQIAGDHTHAIAGETGLSDNGESYSFIKQ